MGDRAAEHGERLIHHKLGNKEERGCRGRAGEPANYDILARARTTKLCLFVKSCRPKLSQINWRRTAARTYSLLGPRLPADLYFLPRFLAGAFREGTMEAAREWRRYLQASHQDEREKERERERERESGSRGALKRHLLLMQMYARYLLPLSILGSN